MKAYSFQPDPRLRSAVHAGAAASDQLFDLGETRHGGVAGGGHGERAVGSAVFDRERGIALFQEAVDKAGGEAVAAADAVEDLEAVALLRLVELAVAPDDRAPVVDRGGADGAEGGGGGLEVRVDGDGAFDHLAEVGGIDGADVRVEALDLESEAGGEVLLVADHHVHVLRDLAVDLAGAFLAADRLPQGRTVVEVVAGHGAVFLGGLQRLDHDAGRGVGERGEDAARVEPAAAELAEDHVEVDVARFELGDRRVAAVGAAHRAADAVAAFREVQAVADLAPHAVIRNPLDEGDVHAALEHEILNETADRIIRERRDRARAEAEAAAESARHVVLAAAFPHIELAGGMDAARARIEAEHDLSEREDVVFARVGGFDFQHGELLVCFLSAAESVEAIFAAFRHPAPNHKKRLPINITPSASFLHPFSVFCQKKSIPP